MSDRKLSDAATSDAFATETRRLPWGSSARDVRAVTRCWLPCGFEEIVALIEDVESLPRWCPAVFLGLEVLEPARRVGKTVRLRTRGWLPYVVRFDVRVARLDFDPPAVAVDVSGDFEGRGQFALQPRNGGLAVEFDWRVRFRKPLASTLMRVLKPLLFTNHVWTLRRAHQSLVLELARRRSPSAAQRARIPLPPPPAWPRWRA